jgi:hypothetical protein
MQQGLGFFYYILCVLCLLFSVSKPEFGASQKAV